MGRWLLAVALSGSLLPTLAFAQGRGGGFGVGHVSMGAPHAAPMGGMRSAPVGGMRGGYVAPRVGFNGAPRSGVRVAAGGQRSAARGGFGTGFRGRGSGFGTNRNFNNFEGNDNFNNFEPFGPNNFQDVPGLGFDFPHLAAVSGNRHFGSRGFGDGFGFGGVFPFGFDGSYVAAPYIDDTQASYDQQAAAQAAADEAAAERAAAADAELDRQARSRRNARSNYDAAASAPVPDTAPLPQDVTEYVFVRRDGGLLFGVGYSWDNGTLRYVTRDGLRRTVNRDALDLGATEQFNEQRGLRFDSPA
jgi:hypothetical protein